LTEVEDPDHPVAGDPAHQPGLGQEPLADVRAGGPVVRQHLHGHVDVEVVVVPAPDRREGACADLRLQPVPADDIHPRYCR
jgi:hypothetical protein